jgi:hypothetical protein
MLKKRYRSSLGPFVFGVVFWGAGMFILTLAFTQFEALTRLFGREPDYILLGLTAILMIVSMILLERIPKRVAILAGTIGWALTFLLAYYWCWFGPDAFGHHH